MKHWIGKSLALIGIIHTLFWLILIVPQMTELLSEGIFGTVNGQPKREAFLWFGVGGFTFIIIGALLVWIEKRGLAIPKWAGYALLALTVFVLIFSPQSGGWLILVPAFGIISRKAKS